MELLIERTWRFTEKDLKYNKAGKIVSKKKSLSAKKDSRLVKADTKLKRVSLGLFIRNLVLKERKIASKGYLLKKPEEKKGIQKEIKYIV